MTATVQVGCRIPNGIILRVTDWVKDPDGNSIPREIAAHEIAGVRHSTVQPYGGSLHEEEDAAFTEIPAADFDKWLEANEQSDLVKSGAIFKASDEDVKKAEKDKEDKVKAEAELQTAQRDEERKTETQRAEAQPDADEPTADEPPKSEVTETRAPAPAARPADAPNASESRPFNPEVAPAKDAPRSAEPKKD